MVWILLEIAVKLLSRDILCKIFTIVKMATVCSLIYMRPKYNYNSEPSIIHLMHNDVTSRDARKEFRSFYHRPKIAGNWEIETIQNSHC